MRDEKRIDKFLVNLAAIWHDYPDLRFVQLIQNVFRNPSDYYLEDNDALKKLEDFYYARITGERQW